MNSLSKAKLKFFSALRHKKFRYEHRLLLAEGVKLLEEALRAGLRPEAVILGPNHSPLPPSFSKDNCFRAEAADLRRLSDQSNPEGIISVIPFPDFPASESPIGPGFILDRIQDPGNLGTLIRVADWFGFKGVWCGKGTADWTNPKVLRSAMGSAFRVQVQYLEELEDWLAKNPKSAVVADLRGTPAREFAWQENDLILLGNESQGVSPDILTIPGLRKVTISGTGGAESLNAAISGGILAWTLKNK